METGDKKLPTERFNKPVKKLLFPLLTITSLVIIGCSDSNSKNAASNTPQFKKMTWTSDQPAAADSLQGQLQAQGKKWVKTSGTIKRGDYVQDILDPRLNQPEGRGAIAKVISVSGGDTGPFTALMQ